MANQETREGAPAFTITDVTQVAVNITCALTCKTDHNCYGASVRPGPGQNEFMCLIFPEIVTSEIAQSLRSDNVDLRKICQTGG